MTKEFPNTNLSVIEKIRTGSDEDRKTALESFVQGYRPALISFLVNCKGVSREDAEDCVHEFILAKIINGKVLDLANGKGRFRNLLRISLQRFLIDIVRKKKREQVDDAMDLNHSSIAAEDQPDQIDQVWATAVFRSALATLKTQSPYWELFVDRVLTHPPLPYSEIIKRHRFESPEKASNCLITAKRQFNRIIHQVIQEQSHWSEAGTEEEILDEIGFLKNQLAEPLLLQKSIEGIDSESMPLTQSHDHSIFGDHLIFIEESTDGLWDNSELPAILGHLLNQPVNKFTEWENPATRIANLLFERDSSNESHLAALCSLKELFNRRGKTSPGPLPEKVDVAMTFAFISAFICRGGEVGVITSMRPNLLAKRIEKLFEKSWLPSRLQSLFSQSVEILLA